VVTREWFIDVVVTALDLIIIIIIQCMCRASEATGHHGFNPRRCTVEFDPGQVYHTHLPLSPSSIIWYELKLGSKQAHCSTLWPRVHGLSALAGA